MSGEILRYVFDVRTAAPNALLIATAILPAVALLFYIYKRDRVNKEPDMLLLALVLLGIASVLFAILAEMAGCALLGLFVPEGTVLWFIIEDFLIIGPAEEGAKYAMLRIKTWRSPHFDCSFDAVVYAVFVSLGFALAENVCYALIYGLGTALLRAVTSIPGHMSFGVFMGACYSLAKIYSRRGDAGRSRRWRVLSVVLPALFHGCYDFLAEITANFYTLALPFLILFAASMIVCAFLLVRALARKDRYI